MTIGSKKFGRKAEVAIILALSGLFGFLCWWQGPALRPQAPPKIVDADKPAKFVANEPTGYTIYGVKPGLKFQEIVACSDSKLRFSTKDQGHTVRLVEVSDERNHRVFAVVNNDRQVVENVGCNSSEGKISLEHNGISVVTDGDNISTVEGKLKGTWVKNEIFRVRDCKQSLSITFGKTKVVQSISISGY